jgi:hypothetical protein
MNPVESLEKQTWFEKMKLILSIMVKLPSLIFYNDEYKQHRYY